MDDFTNRITNRLPGDQRPPSIATLRLIVTALILGACIFGGTVIFSASRIGAKIFDDPLIAYILAAASVLVIGLQMAVPKFMKPIAGADDVADLKRYGAMTLTRIGMLEGMTVLNYVFYLLSQNEATLIAGIVLVLVMLFIRPSDAKFQKWRDGL